VANGRRVTPGDDYALLLQDDPLAPSGTQAAIFGWQHHIVPLDQALDP
jgi:hypothetical protein